MTVPGRSGSLTAWNVIELAADRAQLDHRLSRTLAPFVGRRQDLAVLQDSLEQAATGRGQVINVAGEPGIGKSRLLYELRRAGESAGTVLFEGRCLSYASSIPYVPIVDIVRQACGITGRDSADTIRHKVTDRARATRDGWRVERRGQHVSAPRPGRRRRRRSAARTESRSDQGADVQRAASLVLFESRREPVALLVEDLHWIDKPSEEFFETLVDGLPGARILLVATYRPGYRAPWMDRSYATQITLHPLSAA